MNYKVQFLVQCFFYSLPVIVHFLDLQDKLSKKTALCFSSKAILIINDSGIDTSTFSREDKNHGSIYFVLVPILNVFLMHF